MLKNPALFQVELVDLIEKYSLNQDSKIVEVGCETGITSLLLSARFNKTLLDINTRAIKLCKEIFDDHEEKADFVVADMFSTPFADQSFDVVFNAGVLEHFTEKEVIDALTEYKRIMKKNGSMIIGIPNHFSVPYRLAYLFRIALDKVGIHKWAFPKERKIYDLRGEIETAGLMLYKRETMAKESIFNWWDFLPPVKWVFKKLDQVYNFEGYLTVLLIKNCDERQ